MARPKICKNICAMPNYYEFSPINNDSEESYDALSMSLEEYEVIRLIDKMNMTQEQCAEQMGVSRPTVQIIYENARKKIADFLVDGKLLKLEGGNYRLCDRVHRHCHREFCCKELEFQKRKASVEVEEQ